MKLARMFAAPIPAEDVPYIVPVETATGYVGPKFIERLAAELKGEYERDPENIGLMDDFDVLKGRWCDPAKVHPLIHEFYEHTSRFTVAVRPRWNWFFLPLFWLFRRIFAELVGQFNLPVDDAEAGQGLESHIDCIDMNQDKVVDLRGWVRTYVGTDTTVYVGVYTTVSLSDGPYVSVGFPLPEANLTATLVPMNRGKHDFLLKSRKWGSRWAGDYIACIDQHATPKRISAYRLRSLREEIEVYVRNDQLFTDHRFYFLGCKFLTLLYRLTRKESRPVVQDVAALAVKAPSVRSAGPVRLARR
ncbi:MAG: hypothetical protein ACLGH0_04030 [Thermoanaerobaculia bacterium]